MDGAIRAVTRVFDALCASPFATRIGDTHQVATCTRTAVDRYRPDDLSRAPGEQTRTWRDRHDHAHRPRWIGLRPRNARHGRERGSASGQMQKLSAGKFHNTPLEMPVKGPSLRLDIGGLDHFAPLLGLVSDELSGVGRKAWKCSATQFGEARLHIGVCEGRVDLVVELVDDFSRRVLGRADAKPNARLVPWHKFVYGRDVRQCVRARRGGYCKRAQSASFDILN